MKTDSNDPDPMKKLDQLTQLIIDQLKTVKIGQWLIDNEAQLIVNWMTQTDWRTQWDRRATIGSWWPIEPIGNWIDEANWNNPVEPDGQKDPTQLWKPSENWMTVSQTKLNRRKQWRTDGQWRSQTQWKDNGQWMKWRTVMTQLKVLTAVVVGPNWRPGDGQADRKWTDNWLDNWTMWYYYYYYYWPSEDPLKWLRNLLVLLANYYYYWQ